MEHEGQKYNVICLSNQLWEFPLWTNKKHVMTRLAAAGHNVLFVDPPINTGRVFFKYLSKGAWSLKRLITKTYIDENVKVVSPLNILPFPRYLSAKHAQMINKVAEKTFNKDFKTLLWVYNVELPGIENYLKLIKHDFLVYDCVDNYAGFPKYDTPEKKKQINLQEQFLSQRANIVFATAPGLVDKLKKFNLNTYYTPNVGDYEKFKNAKEYRNNPPEELKDISRPIIGFTGAVDEYKFDKDLLKKIAIDYPSYAFVIIGPSGLKDRESSMEEIGISGLNNIYFLGSRPYKEMEKYIGAFDVFIIPYQINDYTVGGCFPVKFHDALAAGLPVVVTDLPAYAPFAKECYISKSYNEFSHNIRLALEEDGPDKIASRQQIAKENTWEGKVAKMLGLVADTIRSLQ